MAVPGSLEDRTHFAKRCRPGGGFAYCSLDNKNSGAGHCKEPKFLDHGISSDSTGAVCLVSDSGNRLSFALLSCKVGT